jgi:AcrR family transcriptional regulator
VDKISARLKVTKGSFYHHHDNKDELISACFERTFAVVRRAQELAADSRGSGWQRLCAACSALVRYQLSPDGPLLRVSAWSALPEPARSETLLTLNRVAERFANLIVEGMMDGSIRVLDQSIAAQLVSGMINAAAEIERWVPGVNEENAADLYARPLFMGLLSAAD